MDILTNTTESKIKDELRTHEHEIPHDIFRLKGEMHTDAHTHTHISERKANYPRTEEHDRDNVEETPTANAIRRMQ